MVSTYSSFYEQHLVSYISLLVSQAAAHWLSVSLIATPTIPADTAVARRQHHSYST